MAARRSCWSSLPKELLSSIAKHLDTRMDVFCFRAVCSSWRGSVPVPPKSPKLPLQVQFLVNFPPTLASYLISQVTVYRIVQPDSKTHSNGKSWFIKIEQMEQDKKFRVLDPFSRDPVKNMPASFPKELNHLNFRVEETARAFNIRRIREDGDSDINEKNPLFRKIELNSDFDSSYRVVALSSGNLCRMRVDTDIQWCLLHSDVQYRDITNFNGMFFTVDLRGVIFGRDETTFSLDEIHSHREQNISECERYFVESSGHLYMVSRDFYICSGQVHYDAILDSFVKQTGLDDAHVPVRFRVYKRIPSAHRQNKFDWVEVNDLGDRVFFVSTDCSFSFSTRDSEGCDGNCIIYVDEIKDIQHLNNEERDGADNDDDGHRQIMNVKAELFNLADQSSGPLAFFPQYLAMFWPPPTWLMCDQGSSSS